MKGMLTEMIRKLSSEQRLDGIEQWYYAKEMKKTKANTEELTDSVKATVESCSGDLIVFFSCDSVVTEWYRVGHPHLGHLSDYIDWGRIFSKKCFWRPWFEHRTSKEEAKDDKLRKRMQNSRQQATNFDICELGAAACWCLLFLVYMPLFFPGLAFCFIVGLVVVCFDRHYAFKRISFEESKKRVVVETGGGGAPMFFSINPSSSSPKSMKAIRKKLQMVENSFRFFHDGSHGQGIISYVRVKIQGGGALCCKKAPAAVHPAPHGMAPVAPASVAVAPVAPPSVAAAPLVAQAVEPPKDQQADGHPEVALQVGPGSAEELVAYVA